MSVFKSKLSPLFSSSLIVFFLLNFSSSLYSAANYTSGSNATELANQIQGNGLIITNPILKRGNSRQTGVFSNAKVGAGLEIDEGIILTAMSVEEAFTSNSSGTTSINNNDISTDSDLLAIDARAKYDTVVFEFDVTLEQNTKILLIEYQFASEEYNEYVGSQFNDAFGFFLSGGDLNQTYNIARVVDSSVRMTTTTIQSYPAVTVNNVNNGSVGIYDDGTPEDLTNSSYFIDNTGNHPPVTVEFDGLTKKLQAAVDNLTPGITYHFKMALADTGDSFWDSGVFVKKIVGIKEPQFCFDYSYSQNGKYFTEYNNGSKDPFIQGAILPNDDINVTIYLRNIETSDILAQNITLDIVDINTTQAIYKRNSVSIVNTGNVIPEPISDTLLTVNDANIKQIPYNDLSSQSYAYLYYGLIPQNISDINISLNAQIHYDVDIYIGGDPSISSSYINQHYDPFLGGFQIPMCNGDNSKYEVDWGIFNIVSQGIYSYPNSIKYNIPTQVVNRPHQLSLIAINPQDQNLIQENNSSTIVGVDIIDAAKFHSVKASCDEPSSAISPRVWIPFNNNSSVNLDQKLNNSFYANARQNAAYRVSYLVTNDGLDNLIDTSPNGNKLIINNFTELVQNISLCKQPVVANSTTSNTTNQVAVACGNAGNSGLDSFEYQRCLQCLYGYNTRNVCSRDNFSIRPESFNVKLSDMNQSNTSQTKPFAQDRTGVQDTYILDLPVNIVAGYNYKFDVNATTHGGNDSANGYIRIFSSTPTNDHNMSFVWTPTTPTNPLECNDIDNKYLTFNIINGATSLNSNISNIGEYILNVIDKGWTSVDWNAAKIAHHGGINGTYFVQGTDCITNSSIVEANSTLPTITSNAISNTNGCTISTNNHLNQDNGLRYRDYNLSVLPYKFNLDNLVISQGPDFNSTVNNAFIYKANVDDNASRDMAWHAIGNIEAQGFNNITLSNFTGGCFAKDINVTIARNMPSTLSSAYQIRLTDINSTGAIVSDFVSDINDTNITLSLSEGNFTKDMSGSIDARIDMNFERDELQATNPMSIDFKTFDTRCSNETDCTFQANLDSNQTTFGRKDINATLKHYYGRVHAPDYRFAGNEGNATIYYEVYCKDCNSSDLNDFNITGAESVDSIYWYQNVLHSSAYGSSAATPNHINKYQPTTLTHTDSKSNLYLELKSTTTRPFVDKVNLNPPSWLEHYPTDFTVEFLGKGDWAGAGRVSDSNISGAHTHDTAPNRVNKRLEW